jgi:hypothetical protein
LFGHYGILKLGILVLCTRIIQFVLRPRGWHDIAFDAAGTNPSRQTGEIYLHEAVYGSGIRRCGEDEINLTTWAIATAWSPYKEIGMLRRRLVTASRKPRNAIGVRQECVVGPPSFSRLICWHAEDHVETLAGDKSLLDSNSRRDLRGAPAS